jgi:hypothetical protein
LAIAAAGGHIQRMAEAKNDTPEPVTPKTPPADEKPAAVEREIGGPKGPEPTRFGDWEVNGRCTDF